MDEVNEALDNVLKKIRKGKLPDVVEPPMKKKVLVDSDIMSAVNQRLSEMMSIINKQQTEIEQLKTNDKKMLEVVVTSHDDNEVLKKTIKRLKRENKKLLKHEQRNTRRIIVLKEENKQLKKSNKNMDNLIKDLCSRAPQLQAGEEDKEREEEQVDFEPSDEEEDEELDEDAGNDTKKKKKDDKDDGGSDDGSSDGNGSSFDDSSDDDNDDADKFTYEKRDSSKGGESSSKAPGENVDDDIFWNEKLQSLSEDDKNMYRQMLTDRVWTIDMTSRFPEIFESSNKLFELEIG